MKFLMILILVFSFSSLGFCSTNSPEELKARIEKVYNELNANTLGVLDNFYDANVEFHDPIGTVNGLKNIKAYYGNMYKNVKSISFQFHDFIIQDQNVVATWTMTYSVDSLNSGAPIKVEGNSFIKFGGAENKAIYHRDYFDVGSMVYEHIPFLGYFVRKIKHKLEK